MRILRQPRFFRCLTSSPYHSLEHHSGFSDRDRSNALAGINARLMAGRAFLRGAQHVFVTLGTAHAYVYSKEMDNLDKQRGEGEGCNGEESKADGAEGIEGREEKQQLRAKGARDGGQIVANCHRLPAACFRRKLLGE